MIFFMVFVDCKKKKERGKNKIHPLIKAISEHLLGVHGGGKEWGGGGGGRILMW